MPRWTLNELNEWKRRNASLQVVGAGKASELERHSINGALGSSKGKETSSERVLVRFVSVRKRLLDPDNISEKWMLDCLRFVRIIQGDEPDKIELQTTQRKCAKGEAEHTEISVFRLNTSPSSLSKEDK